MWLWACTNILYLHECTGMWSMWLWACTNILYLHECTGMWSIWLWACTNITTSMYRHVIYVTVSLYQHNYINVQACDLFDCEPVPTYLHECTGMWSIWLWACTNITTSMYRHVIYLTGEPVPTYLHECAGMWSIWLWACTNCPTSKILESLDFFFSNHSSSILPIVIFVFVKVAGISSVWDYWHYWWLDKRKWRDQYQ